MWKKKTFVFLVLFCSYAAYSGWVYTRGTEQTTAAISTQAAAGKQLWQQNNCSSCHQLYGLGGYLGPDLTNIISDPKRGSSYAKAFIAGGGATMPKFHLNEEQVEAVVAYLAYVDESVKNNSQ